MSCRGVRETFKKLSDDAENKTVVGTADSNNNIVSVCAVTVGANDVLLTTRAEYEIYSGDLDVSVSIPDTLNVSGVSLELVSLLDDRRFTIDQLPVGFNNDISVACGAVDFAGQFVLRLVADDAGRQVVVASTSPVNVTWPSSAVTLSLPTSHRALTGSLALSVDVFDLQCDSVHQGVYYMLKLLYLGRDDEAADATGYHHSPRVIDVSHRCKSVAEKIAKSAKNVKNRCKNKNTFQNFE